MKIDVSQACPTETWCDNKNGNWKLLNKKNTATKWATPKMGRMCEDRCKINRSIN